ncbi:DUF6114 domain-containing protein [Streptomyces sp. NPDC048256]|uniref:DUF6114 domain-containing protein n=1 Tax=Streptomyces sp. NPDC048256 TaxID=3154613 RepID=UPI00340167A7
MLLTATRDGLDHVRFRSRLPVGAGPGDRGLARPDPARPTGSPLAWRRRRPFWAAVWVIAGGIEMVAIPLAPLPLMIRVGVGAMSAVGISVVLVAGGILFLFKPDQRMFVSVVTAVASLTSMATTNLGGLGIGMLAGLIGSSMAFGWLPGNRHPDEDAGDPPAGEGADSARPADAAARADRAAESLATGYGTGGDGRDARGPRRPDGPAPARRRRGPVRTAAHLLLRARALLTRLLPARPDWWPSRPKPRSYPFGWTLDDLGPHWAHHRPPAPLADENPPMEHR